jgi:hypothetical protein
MKKIIILSLLGVIILIIGFTMRLNSADYSIKENISNFIISIGTTIFGLMIVIKGKKPDYKSSGLFIIGFILSVMYLFSIINYLIK